MSDDFWGLAAEPVDAATIAAGAAAAPDGSADALDERGQPPISIGGGGLRRELESMYAVIRADAAARLRWFSR